MAEKRYYNPKIHDKYNTPYGYDGGARNDEESTPRRRAEQTLMKNTGQISLGLRGQPLPVTVGKE